MIEGKSELFLYCSTRSQEPASRRYRSDSITTKTEEEVREDNFKVNSKIMVAIDDSTDCTLVSKFSSPVDVDMICFFFFPLLKFFKFR